MLLCARLIAQSLETGLTPRQHERCAGNLRLQLFGAIPARQAILFQQIRVCGDELFPHRRTAARPAFADHRKIRHRHRLVIHAWLPDLRGEQFQGAGKIARPLRPMRDGSACGRRDVDARDAETSQGRAFPPPALQGLDQSHPPFPFDEQSLVTRRGFSIAFRGGVFTVPAR